jgi:hypothetical protein
MTGMKLRHPSNSHRRLQRCQDCGLSTLLLGEYFSVWDYVWKEACITQRQRKRFLCVLCLERRLGRKLQPSDFVLPELATANALGHVHPRFNVRQSARLISRTQGWNQAHVVSYLRRIYGQTQSSSQAPEPA